ncbi:MAG TPA: hypothetical protein VG722_06965 [Tepidisphaeraceae bacterium]|nr:hypothetical protein [Tepidisphaeraceae bacterium]
MEEIRNLSAAELERLVKRLVHHAWCNMRYRTYRGASLARSGLLEAGDFVDIAFKKALSGQRTWNKLMYATLEGFLRSVIDSEMNHTVTSPDSERGRHFPENATGSQQATTYEPPSSEPDPARIVVDQEWPERQKQFHDAAVQQLEGEQFLIDLLNCLEAEISEPAEIATLLGVTVDHVNNEKKRLRRKLERLDSRIEPAKKGKVR